MPSPKPNLTKQATQPKKQTVAPSSGKKPMISCKKFNPDKLLWNEVDMKNERSKNQGIGYINYEFDKTNKSNLIFRTDPVKITDYGIPSLKSDDNPNAHIESDAERAYIKLSLDPAQQSCQELKKMLLQIDEEVVKNKEKILPKVHMKYKYVPIVREPQEIDDDKLEDLKNEAAEKGKTYTPRVREKYCKINFSTNYETKELDTIVFDSTSGTPEEIDVKSMTELADNVKWQSTVRMIIMVNKVWAAKSSKNGELRDFGVSLKCLQLEIKERAATGSSTKDQFKKYALGDDDDDEDDTNSTKKANLDKGDAIVNEEDEGEEDEEVDEDEEEDDEDSPVQQMAPKGKQQTLTNNKQVAQEDEEDEDEEEEDEDEEEVEEVQQPVKAKASSTPPATAAKGKAPPATAAKPKAQVVKK